MTDQAEAVAIASLGVDALGFIFVRSSPRFIEPTKARVIIDNLPPLVNVVGVFMDEEASLVNDIAKSCGLTLIQLHGNESADYCRSIIRPVLKAFRIREEVLPDFEPYRNAAKGFLLDTYRQGQAGGTGATFNWDIINRLSLPGPLFLAGGLSPDNVGLAIHQARPFAIDVNSGVESVPGRKDLNLVQRLLMEVRATESNIQNLSNQKVS